MHLGPMHWLVHGASVLAIKTVVPTFANKQKTVKKIEHGITMYSTTYSYFLCLLLHSVVTNMQERNKYAIQSLRPEVETF